MAQRPTIESCRPTTPKPGVPIRREGDTIDTNRVPCQGAQQCSIAHSPQPHGIPDDANVQGIITLIVACYGAGIPAFDAFLKDRKTGPVAITDKPFMSALPQRLLAHPHGGALGVIGHVERLWNSSFVPPGLPSQLIPFRNFFGRVMSGGEPIGHAVNDFNQRYAVLASEPLKDLDETQSGPKPSTEELAWKWIERTDGQNYVVLGDPAACIRVNNLSY